jgi:hypothetical protein
VTPFGAPEIAEVFDAWPPPVRARLLALRELIYATAADTPGVGALGESLKWGQPAYAPAASRRGASLRIGTQRGDAAHYAAFFNCQTTLVATFRDLYPDAFTFQGNRAIILPVGAPPATEALAHCITLALTYHAKARS